MIKRRNTPQKKIILSLFRQETDCLCLEEIEQRLVSKLDRVTIYRIVNRFCEDGLMHKISGKNGISHFALSKKNQTEHYHFQCDKCQKMICLEESIPACLPQNFIQTKTNCVIIGICPKCQT
ncbi:MULTISPECIES: Fur family transcriptional regulator [Weeksella]|uniref:Transcription regulator n=1 Tax=Weeksella virosa (strain ATCC 43766 / DSM 16922 / JCM 21250 / CCUG 30538 / CDC 9751 / IAM 14551 / NBRC 16016 / NCTC 11634 / CL345/78) TaxID=865938 RepID=F0P1E7_WEEVC|nr:MULTISPECIES: transcriptional repressor [Weeksella]ADX68661.1 putative transcription regulator [Weeksella virosa DSM 16922]MDK7375937.1 transcriptional repressor [Weeksella virosa]MDK7675800.1 transcriptional repressor [Weeksella virosa]